nr:hypothetical protein Iba_scaffold4346CG0290 [Ipomoea batatas]GME06843.1 hypothetical protein Iba_scaffold5164CG0010 [Ipomoea batatas]
MKPVLRWLVTWRCVRRKTNRGRSTNDTKPRPSAAIAGGIANHRRTPLSRLPSPPPSASATVARRGERGVESPSDQPLGGRIRSRCLQKRRRLHRPAHKPSRERQNKGDAPPFAACQSVALPKRRHTGAAAATINRQKERGAAVSRSSVESRISRSASDLGGGGAAKSRICSTILVREEITAKVLEKVHRRRSLRCFFFFNYVAGDLYVVGEGLVAAGSEGDNA